MAVMFQLQLVQLTSADREREIESDLRRRQLLKATAEVEAVERVRSGSAAVLRLIGPAHPGHPALRATAMPHDVISTCPVCANELAVTRLHCRSCGTTLEGDFSVGRFGRLNRDQLALLESFLRSRGNLREMERELGISYPTVRSRVEALVRALGFGPRADADDVDDPAGEAAVPPRTREEILQALARHEMTADEAAAAIRALGRTAS